MSDSKYRMSRSCSPSRTEIKRARHSFRDSRNDTHSAVYNVQRPLPFDARQLTKHDLDLYRPMFTLYLDIQKRIEIEDLTETEIKGRWKSFINKWNRGDLAEGWYDSDTLSKARRSHEQSLATSHEDHEPGINELRGPNPHHVNNKRKENHAQDEDDDEYGPRPLANQEQQIQNRLASQDRNERAGPTIPSYQDIQSRNEDARVSTEAAREKHIETIRHERQLDRKLQKSQLDEIAPRAEAGTRERQLEKKRDLADSNRNFAASKDAGGDVEIRDGDLMGGDDLGDLKRMKKEQDRKRTEREIRREEILRARMAERGQKLKAVRDKEEKTMSMLREIAQERFGGGNERRATLSEDQE